MVDNLSDALLMAGAVLIFVIALTVSMSSFTTMRSQIDEIVQSEEKIDLVTDNSGNYLNYEKASTGKYNDVRVVGVETVVSSMYRVAKENYIVYIKLTNYSDYPSDTITTISDSQVYKNLNTKSPTELEENLINSGSKIMKIDINGKNSNITALLDDKGFYEILKGKKFYEFLGVYQKESGEGVDASNKTTYRVITYVET